MKTISEATIKQLAGDQAFTRGLKLYNQGRVGELSINGHEIKAVVQGKVPYTTTLHHTSKVFEGSCTCPVSDGFEFCKHCAATALAYYYQTQTNQEIAEIQGDERINAYLYTLTKKQLADELARLIKHDKEQSDHWALRAELASGQLSPALVRKHITKAIPYKPSGLWRFKEVEAYFDKANSDLSLLGDAIKTQLPESAFKLITYAAQRFEKTLRNIDDSNGYRLETEKRLVELFNSIIGIGHWSLKSKIEALTNLILDPDFTYDFLNVPYAQLKDIGDDGFNEICKTVEKAWQLLELPEERFGQEYTYYSRLENMLVEQTHDNDDQDKELQILERGALHIERCLELVYLCIEYQQLDRAEKWLRFSEQLKRLTIHEIYDIETAQIALWKALGENKLATQALWARFEESEARIDLEKLLKVVDDDLPWVDRAIKMLGGRIDPADKQSKTQIRAETLARIYIDNGYIDEAKQLHKVFPLRSEAIRYLVSKCDIDTVSIALIEEAVNQILKMAYQNVYQEAVSVLDHHFNRCPTELLDEYNNMVRRVYNFPENKRKTNFIKLLKEAFADIFDS
ncbi:MAG: hypothetical protein MK188_01395 [Gammaproteobacteria bacterium]|nr:hypothetical protein [Gammaproteobacteria bacterium]